MKKKPLEWLNLISITVVCTRLRLTISEDPLSSHIFRYPRAWSKLQWKKGRSRWRLTILLKLLLLLIKRRFWLSCCVLPKPFFILLSSAKTFHSSIDFSFIIPSTCECVLTPNEEGKQHSRAENSNVDLKEKKKVEICRKFAFRRSPCQFISIFIFAFFLLHTLSASPFAQHSPARLLLLLAKNIFRYARMRMSEWSRFTFQSLNVFF